MLKKSRIATIAVLGIIPVLVPATLRADVMGFNDLAGWMYNQGDVGGTPADLPDPDTIHITSLGTSQARSIFYTTPQTVGEFVATFTYQAQNASVFGCDYGATFTLHNDPAGAAAIGGTDFQMGYGGIANSAAISFQLRTNTTGFSTGGNIAGGAASVNPVNLISGNPIDVTLSYNGNILSETLTDTVTMASFSRNIIVGNLASIIGGPTAYVGFTASTTTGACSGNAANQFISGFQFTTVPEPTTLALMMLGGLAVLHRRSRA